MVTNACHLTVYLEDSSIREQLLPISLLSVKVELAKELMTCGPAVESIPMPVVLVERALIVLHKGEII